MAPQYSRLEGMPEKVKNLSKATFYRNLQTIFKEQKKMPPSVVPARAARILKIAAARSGLCTMSLAMRLS